MIGETDASGRDGREGWRLGTGDDKHMCSTIELVLVSGDIFANKSEGGRRGSRSEGVDELELEDDFGGTKTKTRRTPRSCYSRDCPLADRSPGLAVFPFQKRS